MENVKKAALKKAMVLLNAIGVSYAIIDANGKKYGDLEIANKSNKKYIHGELTDHIRTNFVELKIGEVGQMPLGKFEINEIQKCLSSYVCKVYGKGTHTTCMSKDRSSIEILRVA